MVKIRTNKLYDFKLNILLVVLLLIIFGGVFWLALNEVQGGIVYSLMFIGSICALFIIYFFYLGSDAEYTTGTNKIFAKLIKPFTVDLDLAVAFYFMGWCIPFLLTGIGKLFNNSFSVTSFLIPLSANKLSIGLQESLSVAKVQASPFWRWFISVFTAGGSEEFIFAYALPLASIIVAIFFIWMFFGKKVLNSKTGYWIILIISFLIVGGLFAGAHQLNETYDSGLMFLIATIFRLVMNALIYVWGVFLVFTIGYHQANNAIWFYGNYGSNVTINALTSIGGIIVIVFFLALLFYLIRRFPKIYVKTTDFLKGKIK